VLTAIPLLVFIYIAELPAVLVLTTWFGLRSGRIGRPRQPDASFGVPTSPTSAASRRFLLVKLFAWPTRARRRRGGVRYA